MSILQVIVTSVTSQTSYSKPANNTRNQRLCRADGPMWGGHTTSPRRYNDSPVSTLNHYTFLGLAVVLLALFSLPAQAALIAFYNFDGTTNDQSGNGFNPTGSVAGYTAGFDGQAGVFDGSTSFLDIPVNISPAAMPAMTFGAWVSSDVTTGRRAIISADDTSPANWDRQIGIDNRDTNGNDTGAFRYSAFSGGAIGSRVLQGGPGSVPTNQYVFVAARYDGSTTTLFVDGTTASAIDTTEDDPNHESFSRIGKNPNFDLYFDGAIDNLFIYDEALSDLQIANIRNNGAAAIQSVPVPAPLVLFISGLVSMFVFRRAPFA